MEKRLDEVVARHAQTTDERKGWKLADEADDLKKKISEMDDIIESGETGLFADLLTRVMGTHLSTDVKQLAKTKDPVEISKRIYEKEKVYGEQNPKRWATVADSQLSTALGIDRSSVEERGPHLREDYWSQNLEIVRKSKKK